MIFKRTVTHLFLNNSDKIYCKGKSSQKIVNKFIYKGTFRNMIYQGRKKFSSKTMNK